MAAVIGSNSAARLAGFARSKCQEKIAVKAARYPRPMINFLDGRKKKTQFPGDEILISIKEPAFNVAAQKWSGTDSMGNPVSIQNGMMASFQSSNMFSSIQWGFDDLRKSCAVTILPNDNGKTIDARVTSRDAKSERVLFDKLVEDMESFTDRVEELRDLEYHRQGATIKDLSGINSIMPLQNTGLYGGLDRSRIPAVQHVIFAGNDPLSTAPQWMGPRGIVGASGTLLAMLERFFRQLRAAAATSGLPKGRWKCFAGQGFLDLFKTQMRLEKIQFTIDAGSSSDKINLLISDERVGLGAADIDLCWDPTLDSLDIIAASEQGVGMSQLTVTFSGGGATRQGRGVAYVSAAGVITAIAVNDPGEGYTSAPTVTIGNAGGGTGATFQALVFAVGAGAGLTTVPADDARLGRLNGVTILGGGTGFAATNIASLFTNRMYALYEPAWTYWVQDGLDNYMSIPADNPRARLIEQQWDHTHALTNASPRCSGVFVASIT